ncbi:diaminopimelate epimerase [Marilutibacter chinensis]|uniref:Diaminopimelate epimerase n=1 Tax=Marilutibacter chinensis TaxID=2912247 RepID=A0ABS9HRE9_9GAMM|nr:diaminopimelate epimerase [Lysobacter chinensis]MCF7221514.1 diaminopimelate epimerase [Lysobacter chinensis]
MSARPHAASAPRLHFTKMHGAGNDFVVLDLRGGRPPPSPERCRALADRHVGVGCDQILTIEDPLSDGAVAAYGIWNADGSRSQQCGNGARCIAAWLVRDGAAGGERFQLDSPTGRHMVERIGDGRFRIAMGVPEFDPTRIPMHRFARPQEQYIAANPSLPPFGAVSMGNPHALIEADDIAAAPVATIGPALQRDGVFPESVNVGFAQVASRDRVRLRVYERGVGETLACGSGACAAAAILMKRGRIDRSVTIALPGGELLIEWPDDDAPVMMSGPTAFVFEGEWSDE